MEGQSLAGFEFSGGLDSQFSGEWSCRRDGEVQLDSPVRWVRIPVNFSVLTAGRERSDRRG